MIKKEKTLFFYNTSSFYFPQRNKLKRFIRSLCKKEKQEIEEIRIIFSEKKEIRNINKKFLSHDYDTDIITFPFSYPKEPIEAELYINIPVVRRQAIDFNCSFKEELHRIIFHGILHLCGYNDKSEKEKVQMREKENFYLNLYFNNQ